MGELTYFEALKRASLTIKKKGLDQAVADYLLKALAKIDQTQLLLRYRDPLPESLAMQFNEAVGQYLNGVSPQYIIGTTDFYGYQFKVTPDVLIPRQETEELVAWMLADLPEAAQTILDVGTGSGAIGLTLKRQRPNWQVSLSDVSGKALSVATQNSRYLNAEVTLKEGDLLTPFTGQRFTAIVMNPPYIGVEEQVVMDADVLASQPRLALFAPHHGLGIYERLAAQLQAGIVRTDFLYLEIGYQQGLAVKAIFEEHFADAQVEVRPDMAGHDRMVRVIFAVR